QAVVLEGPVVDREGDSPAELREMLAQGVRQCRFLVLNPLEGHERGEPLAYGEGVESRSLLLAAGRDGSQGSHKDEGRPGRTGQDGGGHGCSSEGAASGV